MIRSLRHPSQQVPENLSVSATYRIEPLPDQPTQTRVTARIASEQLSWVCVVLPDRGDIRAELVSTTGIQPERGDWVILLVPAPERTEMQTKFVLGSEEGFPRAAEVDELGTLLEGVSYRPDGVADNQEVSVIGEAGTASQTTDRSPETTGHQEGTAQQASDAPAEATVTDGQAGFTPISTALPIGL